MPWEFGSQHHGDPFGPHMTTCDVWIKRWTLRPCSPTTTDFQSPFIFQSEAAGHRWESGFEISRDAYPRLSFFLLLSYGYDGYHCDSFARFCILGFAGKVSVGGGVASKRPLSQLFDWSSHLNGVICAGNQDP
jgi:hypothetical protein